MERVTQNVGQVGSTGTEQGAEPARRAAAEAPGLQYTRVFSQAGRDPYGEVEWDRRDAVIANERGEAVFEQRGVEVPRFWSQQATNIVVSKYFRGAVGTAEREWSVRQLIGRVVDTIAMWAREQGYFAGDADLAAFSDDLTHLLVHQKGSFNSPVWFNCGIEPHPQLSACFINAVEDTLDSILTLAKTEGMLFKYGSGTGTNLSSLRSSRESLAGGGTASGPVSFMKGYDAFAGVIKSGGKTRRAAKMVILNADHPDLMDFITCKVDEEKKAWALIDAGYDGSFTGTAYGSVFFQNSNNSVRATDDFMRAVIDDGEWQTRAVKDAARVMDTYKARDIMRQIAEATHVCGDPGMQFDTTVNEWHTCPNSDRINASNPCSEYMFLDNSACNLASINLMKFVDARGEFDVEAFKGAVRVFVTAQEIIVGNASYPTTSIERNSFDYRPLGLGYANLGALLMSRGLPYDSDAGRAYAAAITAVMTGEAYAQSARLARDQGGPFAGYEKNREPFLRVMRKHRDALRDINTTYVPADLRDAARQAWDDAVEIGEEHGYRNAQATVLAPTGTIGFMMDCDTTGIEPDIALIKYKKLVGGGLMKIVNTTVPSALAKIGYTPAQVKAIVDYVDTQETIEGAPHLKEKDLPVFDCAFKPSKGHRAIHYMGHIKMMGAVQPFLSGAISKTVNVPKDATPDDIHAGVRRVVAPRREGHRHLPRRQQADAAAEHVERREEAGARRSRRPRAGPPRAKEALRGAAGHHAQVRHPGPRGVHHRRPLRGRDAGRALPRDGEGRLHDFRVCGRLRAGHFVRAPVRRTAAGAGRQVQPHAVRALGHDEEPAGAVRQVDRRLRVPLARHEVPLRRRAVPDGRQRGRGAAVARRRSRAAEAGRGGCRSGGSRVGVGGGDVHRAEPGRRTALQRVRLDHGPQRQLLQVRQLRQYEWMRVGKK